MEIGERYIREKQERDREGGERKKKLKTLCFYIFILKEKET